MAKIHSVSRIFLFLCTSFDYYMRLSIQIQIAHEKLFICLLVRKHFHLDWPTPKSKAKRLHGIFGVIKGLKYNFDNQNRNKKNIWKLELFILGKRFSFWVKKLIFNHYKMRKFFLVPNSIYSSTRAEF